MALRILICDDSAMARKQMARALPADWAMDVHFAKHGVDALSQLRGQEWDLLFLDLNMPELDGYGVLEAIAQEDLPVMTVVVSGDIQPEARARVLKLGALEFIRKPTDPERIAALLQDYGIYRPDEDAPEISSQPTPEASSNEVLSTEASSIDTPSTETTAPEIQPSDTDAAGSVDLHGYLQEIANVAMGQASDLLARLLDTFIRQPIPKVDRLARSELYMAISAADDSDTYSAVCQGFTGAGLAGEALLLFSDSSIQNMASLLGYRDSGQTVAVEVLMDLSGILFGAFLKGFGTQLNLSLGLGHPTLLGQHQRVNELLEYHGQHQEHLLCIEIRYEIEGHDLHCDLLVVLTEDSVPFLEQSLQYLSD
ncbi:MAG: response regulator [Pseudomonadales bacterium]|nr:response regulator [Pseudomonadales bacterium]